MYVRYHFVVVYIYAGTINRPLQQLVFCHNIANGLPTTQRTLLKHPTNAPETPHIHSARRRGRFIVPVSSYYQICVCLLPFCGCLHICGHDKSAPTAACCFAITLLTVCQQRTNTPKTLHIHTAKTILLQHNRIGTKIH